MSRSLTSPSNFLIQMHLRNLTAPYLIEFLFLCLFGLLPLLWFTPGYLIAGWDYPISFTNVDYVRAFFTWDNWNLGIDNSPRIALIPFLSIFALGRLVGISIVDMERIWFVLVFTSIGVAMWLGYRMLFSVSSRCHSFGGLVAALSYMCSFYVAIVWHEGQMGLLYGYAFLPLVVAFVYGVLRGRKTYIKPQVVIPILVTLVLVASTSIIDSIMLFIVILLVLVYMLILHRPTKNLVFLGSFVGGYLLLTSWWLLPNVAMVVSENYSYANIGKDFLLFHEDLVDLVDGLVGGFRLTNYWIWHIGWNRSLNWNANYTDTFISFAEQYSQPFLIFVGFGLFAGAILGFVLLRQVKTSDKLAVYFIGIMLVLGLFLANGMHKPLGPVFRWLWDHIPFFFIFRSPWRRFTPWVAVSIAILLGFVVDSLRSKLTSRCELSLERIVGTIFPGVIVIAIALNGLPLLTGAVIEFKRGHYPSFYIKVPEYYWEITEILNGEPDEGNVLLMPKRGWFYNWGYAGTNLLRELLTSGKMTEMADAPGGNKEFAQVVYEALYNPGSKNIQWLLSLANIKYILQQNDVEWDLSYEPSPQQTRDSLHENPSIQRQQTIGEIDLYNLADYTSHQIYASPTNYIYVLDQLESLLPLSTSSVAQPLLSFVQMPQPQLKNEQTWESEIAENLLTQSQVIAFHKSGFADLILDMIPSKFVHAIDDQETNYISINNEEPGTFAIFARLDEEDLTSIYSPVIGDKRSAAPAQPNKNPQLLDTAYKWRYLGNIFLSDGNQTLRLIRHDSQHLTNWSLIQTTDEDRNFDFYETSLPEFVPAEYSTEVDDIKIFIYHEDQELVAVRDIKVASEKIPSMTNHSEEYYLVSKDNSRRVMINVPKGQQPVGTYSVAHIVSQLGEVAEEFIVVPLSALETTMDKAQKLVRDSRYRVVHLFTPLDPKNSTKGAARNLFHTSDYDEYNVRIRISPNASQDKIHVFPEKTNWDEEFANFMVLDQVPIEDDHSTSNIEPLIVFYDQTWHNEERDHHGGWRWGKDNFMHMIMINPSPYALNGSLVFRVSTVRERDLDVMVNDQFVKSVHLFSNHDIVPRTFLMPLREELIGSTIPLYQLQVPPEWTTVELPNIKLKPGENEIIFYTPQTTDVMNDLFGNGDERDVNIQLWEDVIFSGIGISGDTDKNREIGNVQFEVNVDNHRLELDAHFDGDAGEQEFVILNRDISSVDLEEFPKFYLDYSVNDPMVATVDVAFGIDYTGDGDVDDYVLGSSTQKDDGNGMQISLDLFAAAKEQFSYTYFNERRDLKLVCLYLIPHKIWNIDVKNTERSGHYTFSFGDMNLYNDRSILVPSQVILDLEDEELIKNMISTSTFTRTQITSDVYLNLPYPVKILNEVKQNTDIASLFDSPIVMIDGQEFTFQPPNEQSNIWDKKGYWSQPLTVSLNPGIHELEILPHPTFQVDLVEVANKPFKPEEASADLTFRKVNPTRYIVEVDAWDSFWLVFSQSFHPDWKAYIVDRESTEPTWYEWSALLTWFMERGQREELTDHYQVNAYANGWHVPKTGKYNLTLEYIPQRFFEIGVLIFAITLLICFGFLVRDFKNRR